MRGLFAERPTRTAVELASSCMVAREPRGLTLHNSRHAVSRGLRGPDSVSRSALTRLLPLGRLSGIRYDSGRRDAAQAATGADEHGLRQTRRSSL
jgi:hypothetical protein